MVYQHNKSDAISSELQSICKKANILYGGITLTGQQYTIIHKLHLMIFQKSTSRSDPANVKVEPAEWNTNISMQGCSL